MFRWYDFLWFNHYIIRIKPVEVHACIHRLTYCTLHLILSLFALSLSLSLSLALSLSLSLSLSLTLSLSLSPLLSPPPPPHRHIHTQHISVYIVHEKMLVQRKGHTSTCLYDEVVLLWCIVLCTER